MVRALGVVRGGVGLMVGKWGVGRLGWWGSIPRYRAGRNPLLRGFTGVVAPRYPPVRGRARVAGAK